MKSGPQAEMAASGHFRGSTEPTRRPARTNPEASRANRLPSDSPGPKSENASRGSYCKRRPLRTTTAEPSATKAVLGEPDSGSRNSGP